jgi:hypothetical protein
MSAFIMIVWQVQSQNSTEKRWNSWKKIQILEMELQTIVITPEFGSVDTQFYAGTSNIQEPG